MIPQKSFQYANFLLKKYFLILSMLKTVVLLNTFLETVNILYHDSLMKRKFKQQCKSLYF